VERIGWAANKTGTMAVKGDGLDARKAVIHNLG